jgi:hypothetical protein
VDKEVGHIIGKVLWHTKIKDKTSSLHIAYDIAWEYSSLGESSIAHSYLVDACHVGSHIFTLGTSARTSESQLVLRTSARTRESQPVSRTSACTSESQPVSWTSARTTESRSVSQTSACTTESRPVLTEQIEEVSDRQRKNWEFIMEKYWLAFNEISDEDTSMGAAPVSDQNSDSESGNDNFGEWLIFGQQELDPCIDDEILDLFEDKEPSPDEAKDETMLEPFDSFHWEIGTELNEGPQDKKQHMETKIKDGYKHHFITPVDAMFALMPYVFWELMCHEINWYAIQYMEAKELRYINACKRKPTSVQEILTFFGILINAMLFPTTGRHMRDSWDDPVRNPWICQMSKGRFQQLRVMLHFNNNEDTDRLKMIHYIKSDCY